MKLPIPSFKKKDKQKYILALLLRDEKISAIITEEVEGKMRIVGQNEELLKTPLEKLSEEDWLDVLDRTISKAEETLPPDRETHDTVFGVKESWVEEKKIKKDYLLKLKKTSETLDLTPIGFLVISEAITHLIQEEEGAPVSAILVDTGAQSVTATLVRGGKVLEAKTVPKDGTLPESVDAALKHFTSVEVFPSRLILFSGNALSSEAQNIDQLAQLFISHHWSKSLPFLHPPQISVLASGFDAKAMVQGAASQMGFEVLNMGIGSTEDIKTYDQEKPHAKKGHEKDAEETPDEKPSKKAAKDEEEQEEVTEPTETDEVSPSEDFGFVLDEEVTSRPPQKATKQSDDSDDDEEKIEHHAHQATHHVADHASDNLSDEGFSESDNDERGESGGEKKSLLAPLAGLTGIFAGLTKLPAKLPLKNLPSIRMTPGRGKLLIIPIILLVLLGGLYFLYTANLKAEVTLYLKPNNVTQNADVLFSTEAGNNFSDGVIGAKTVSTNLDGTVSGAVSGKKAIGEKSKGNVTIFNNDDGKRNLSAGTTITTEKGLKFTLDKDVSIASASGDIFSGTKPGTAQVAVTAAEIGTDYNLPSGTKFNVSGGSNIAAKNDSAFSGGSKKDVTVVSKKDQDKLSSDLSKSLEAKAKEELSKKATGDQKLLPFLTQASVTEKKFDRKVDQEAKTLKLVGTVSYEALTYSEKDLEDYATTVLKNKYDENVNLSEKGITYEITNQKQRGEGEIAADISIGAGLVPKLDTEELIARIQGMPVAKAQEELNKLPQVGKSVIKLSPALPFLPVSLPKADDRITLKTALDE